jgi:hypothetical protein
MSPPIWRDCRYSTDIDALLIEFADTVQDRLGKYGIKATHWVSFPLPSPPFLIRR